MSDLKLIDELLIDLKDATGQTFAELERSHPMVRDAIARLRKAWANGEIRLMTLSLRNYIEGRR